MLKGTNGQNHFNFQIEGIQTSIITIYLCTYDACNGMSLIQNFVTITGTH